mmetsp:Transcript_738/g.1079  ORF Transcript_738/g.1079 Transcript_738/m.1079 type:complete len:86 (+) Transcript_738:304-561(+)
MLIPTINGVLGIPQPVRFLGASPFSANGQPHLIHKTPTQTLHFLMACSQRMTQNPMISSCNPFLCGGIFGLPMLGDSGVVLPQPA